MNVYSGQIRAVCVLKPYKQVYDAGDTVWVDIFIDKVTDKKLWLKHIKGLDHPSFIIKYCENISCISQDILSLGMLEIGHETTTVRLKIKFKAQFHLSSLTPYLTYIDELDREGFVQILILSDIEYMLFKKRNPLRQFVQAIGTLRKKMRYYFEKKIVNEDLIKLFFYILYQYDIIDPEKYELLVEAEKILDLEESNYTYRPAYGTEEAVRNILRSKDSRIKLRGADVESKDWKNLKGKEKELSKDIMLAALLTPIETLSVFRTIVSDGIEKSEYGDKIGSREIDNFVALFKDIVFNEVAQHFDVFHESSLLKILAIRDLENNHIMGFLFDLEKQTIYLFTGKLVEKSCIRKIISCREELPVSLKVVPMDRNLDLLLFLREIENLGPKAVAEASVDLINIVGELIKDCYVDKVVNLALDQIKWDALSDVINYR